MRRKATQRQARPSESGPVGHVPYQVGYGRPPIHTRFQKGRSGNPRGRPPRQGRSLKDLMLAEAYRKITIRDGNAATRMPAVQVLIRSLFNEAIKGKGSAQRDALKFLHTIQAHQESEQQQAADDQVERERTDLMMEKWRVDTISAFREAGDRHRLETDRTRNASTSGASGATSVEVWPASAQHGGRCWMLAGVACPCGLACRTFGRRLAMQPLGTAMIRQRDDLDAGREVEEAERAAAPHPNPRRFDLDHHRPSERAFQECRSSTSQLLLDCPSKRSIAVSRRWSAPPLLPRRLA